MIKFILSFFIPSDKGEVVGGCFKRYGDMSFEEYQCTKQYLDDEIF